MGFFDPSSLMQDELFVFMGVCMLSADFQGSCLFCVSAHCLHFGFVCSYLWIINCMIKLILHIYDKSVGLVWGVRFARKKNKLRKDSIVPKEHFPY